MRRSALMPLCLIALISCVSEARAAGNVLLPSTSGSSSSAPNLGIAPPLPSPTQTPVSPSDETQSPSAGQTASTPATPAPATTSPEQAVSPADLARLQQLLGAAQNAASNQQQLEPTEEAMKSGRMPTTIVDNTANDQLLAETQQGGQYTMSLAISPKSTYGDASLNLLNERFGLSRTQVPSSCVMTVTGTVGTSKGNFPIAGSPSPRSTVRYDGNVTTIIAEPTVYCAVKNLPRGAGYVVKSGNYFKLALDGTICTPPTPHPGQVTVLFTDIGNVQCAF